MAEKEELGRQQNEKFNKSVKKIIHKSRAWDKLCPNFTRGKRINKTGNI